MGGLSKWGVSPPCIFREHETEAHPENALTILPQHSNSCSRMSDASDTLWDQYVDDYHDFWDYVEEHEEILQKGSNVTLVRDIMEECPVVNFSCVRDLIYTMRQFLGEKRFREKEGQCKALLKSKIRECITSFNSAEEEESEEESEVEVNSNNFLRKRLTTHGKELIYMQYTRSLLAVIRSH